MNFEELIQLQVLKLKAENAGRGPLLEAMLDQAGDIPQVRQMCAKVSHVLYDDLENVCALLDMSKREFIEGAVKDALARAHEVIDRSGIVDQFDQKGA